MPLSRCTLSERLSGESRLTGRRALKPPVQRERLSGQCRLTCRRTQKPPAKSRDASVEMPLSRCLCRDASVELPHSRCLCRDASVEMPLSIRQTRQSAHGTSLWHLTTGGSELGRCRVEPPGEHWNPSGANTGIPRLCSTRHRVPRRSSAASSGPGMTSHEGFSAHPPG